MADVTIYIPHVEAGRVADDLAALTERASHLGYQIGGGVLGGAFGYGAWVANSIFGMHPFCWCERDNCPWCAPCSCPDEATVHTIDGETVSSDFFWDTGGFGGAGVRECRGIPELRCHWHAAPFVAPNFWHYPSRSWIVWYKYIGRDMNQRLNAPWSDIIADVHANLTSPPGTLPAVTPPPFGPRRYPG